MTTPYEFRPRLAIDRSHWDRLADTSDDAWMWHLSDLVDIFALNPAYTDLSFGVFERESLCAIVPLYLSAQRKAPLITHRFLDSFGGPALAAGLVRSQRRKILAAIREHLFHLLELHDAERAGLNVSALAKCYCGPDAVRVNPFLELGFKNAQSETWVVDLRPSPEIIRAGYLNGARYELKRATRDAFIMREAAGSRDLEIHFDLQSQTNARSKRPPPTFDILKTIFERCIPAGLARFVFFERKGRVIASQATAIYREGAYYWFGPSATERAGGENRVLCDHQIMYAREHGCTLYETGDAAFDTSDAKLKGISDYKRSFGATLVPRYSARIVSPHWKFRVMRSVAELLRD